MIQVILNQLETIFIFSANFGKEILKDTAKIKAWVDDVVNDVRGKGLDGVNIDFEDEISCSDDVSRQGFNHLMKSLKQKLKKHNLRSQVIYNLLLDFFIITVMLSFPLKALNRFCMVS